MLRYIPRKTKVKLEFFRGVTIADIIIGIIVLSGFVALLGANFENNFWIALAELAFGVSLFLPISEGVRMYYGVVLLYRFFAYTKKYNIKPTKKVADVKSLIPYNKITADKFIDYGDYYGMVVEIKPLEFFLLSPEKQNTLIRTFISVISKVGLYQKASLIKTRKPIVYDRYILNDESKFETMTVSVLKGEMKEEESDARTKIFESRVGQLIDNNERNRQLKDHFYFVVYDKDRNNLEAVCDSVVSSFINATIPIHAEVLRGKDIAVFLKSNYVEDFDEREADNMSMNGLMNWSMPEEVEFKTAYTKVNGKGVNHYVIKDYPLAVPDAWGYNIFAMPETRVAMHFSPVQRLEAEKQIDKAILEMESKALYSSKTSRRIENETHLETLRNLLIDIKNSNENLFNCNMIISCASTIKKEVRSLLRESGFKYDEMFGRQVDAFVTANISRLDVCKHTLRGINTSAVAAVFPFISGAVMDEAGFYIGYNENYGDVYIDFFRRDNERVNSNMMIIGKSGGGKSFATKTLLANMAADNSKVFILDPENEYEPLAYNLKGDALDVGTGTKGRINPFHIVPSLKEDDGAISDDYNGHLQFLEQFFRIVLVGINSDAFEKINTLVIETYEKKRINASTDLESLKAEDFPIFDDLFETVKKYSKTEKDEYIKRIYQVIEIYIAKFASGGRNANLWNGPTTLETKENFTTFSFRSLLSNNNSVLANAQMLLVLRYLFQEIIKNREYNKLAGYNESDPFRRKVIVAVDEAHVFIDEDNPVALDFMEQLAKRIRKYDGMQIIITQNIKDFVGSDAIAKKSTAIINASQFTMIFGLAPNDMNDLMELYRNAGGINDDEKDAIATAARGEAFLITSPNARTNVKIVASKIVREMFEKKL